MIDPWEMIVSLNGPSAIDADEVRRALGVLLDPQGCHELRGLPMPGSRRVESRMACGSNLDAAVESVSRIASGIGTYYTLNLVRADLGDRAAKVGDITSRRWILIDCDRSKAECPDAMATHAEKTAAQELAGRVASYLVERGFPLPVIIDSGNGQHLLYLIDLPANEETRVLVRGFLKALAGMFDLTNGPTIGAECHNASRISKLPGTWVRKGQNTPERPWRMARLMFVPDPLEVVSRELIDAVAGIATTEEPAPVPGPDPWEMIVQGGQDRITAYVRSAVDRETVKVLLAPEGKRNGFLNEAAFALGQFVGAHLLGRDEVVRDLTRAACGCGLDRDPGCGDRGIAATIASGLEAGILQPRVIPQTIREPSRNGNHENRKIDTSNLIVWASDVEPEEVEWLWENRIAIGFISIFAGQTGIGKSFVLLDIIARLTSSRALPDGGPIYSPIRALVISEDPQKQVLRPRLDELKADVNRVAFMTWHAMATYTLSDIALLEAAYQLAMCPPLIIIDPPANFLGGKDEHKNAEVRAVLKGLIEWLETKHVACVFITHTNKQVGKGIEAIYRIMGSVAWGSTARVAIGFTSDPDDPTRCLMTGMKNNLGPKAETLAYQITRTNKLAVVEWQGQVNTTADDAMNKVKKNRKINAETWLVELFRQQREWPSIHFWNEAKQNGISKNAIDEARARLDIPKARRSVTPSGDVCWTWWVPLDWKYLAEDPLQT